MWHFQDHICIYYTICLVWVFMYNWKPKVSFCNFRSFPFTLLRIFMMFPCIFLIWLDSFLLWSIGDINFFDAMDIFAIYGEETTQSIVEFGVSVNSDFIILKFKGIYYIFFIASRKYIFLPPSYVSSRFWTLAFLIKIIRFFPFLAHRCLYLETFNLFWKHSPCNTVVFILIYCILAESVAFLISFGVGSWKCTQKLFLRDAWNLLLCVIIFHCLNYQYLE